MSFTTLIAQFAKQAPIATMVRGLMANILSPAELNAIFRETAERQYESPLLFSTVVDLLGLVVSKAQPSLELLSNVVDGKVSGGGFLGFDSVDKRNSLNHVG
jgi:hypothetical protein